MNYKRKRTIAQFGGIYPAAFSVIWVTNVYVDAAIIVVCFASTVWLVTLGIKGDPEAQRQREKELQYQKTRELEEELGYEPLNLHELDPIFDEIEKEKPHE